MDVGSCLGYSPKISKQVSALKLSSKKCKKFFFAKVISAFEGPLQLIFSLLQV